LSKIARDLGGDGDGIDTSVEQGSFNRASSNFFTWH